jgi:hypothetical protein
VVLLWERPTSTLWCYENRWQHTVVCNTWADGACGTGERGRVHLRSLRRMWLCILWPVTQCQLSLCHYVLTCGGSLEQGCVYLSSASTGHSEFLSSPLIQKVGLLQGTLGELEVLLAGADGRVEAAHGAATAREEELVQVRVNSWSCEAGACVQLSAVQCTYENHTFTDSRATVV